MKKMIISTITIAIVLFFAIGFYKANQLKTIQIQKSVLINAELESVFKQVQFLNNFPKWSPFYEADPSQKTEVKGTDGQVGAQFHWVGNKGKDVGYQEIKEIKNLEYIKMGCDIQKPFIAKPTFEYSFSQVDNGVEVKQDFALKSGLVDCFFMWLFGAKSDMAKMNQRGLELLKEVCEK